MKKLIALLSASALILSLAACGGNDDAEVTAQAPDTTLGEIVDAPVEDDTITEESSDVEESSAPVEESSAPVEEESSEAAPAGDMTAAQFVEFINAETAKIAKGTYKYKRVCEYTSPIDVGNATDTLNKLINGIDKGSDLDSVVGGFLGIGTTEGTYPTDEPDSDYTIKATKLKESDLGSFKAENGTYTFTLANATDPKKTDATPISRFTNDFITHEEVVDGIAEFTSAIKVKSTVVNYKNIKVTVKVENGKITGIDYSYAFDAKLELSLIVKINGSGAAVTNGSFTEIKY